MNASDEDQQHPIPTDWPRNLTPSPDLYFHRKTLTDAAKIRAQGLKRYHKAPEKWIAAVRRWQASHPDYVAAYQAWWWKQNRSEARLAKMRAYTKAWRVKKHGSVEAHWGVAESPSSQGTHSTWGGVTASTLAHAHPSPSAPTTHSASPHPRPLRTAALHQWAGSHRGFSCR